MADEGVGDRLFEVSEPDEVPALPTPAGASKTFPSYDQSQSFLLPPSLDDWVAGRAGHTGPVRVRARRRHVESVGDLYVVCECDGGAAVGSADDVEAGGLRSRGWMEMDDDQAYRAMDLLVAADAQAEVQEAVFFAVADLLNLEVDLLFFDTTSSTSRPRTPMSSVAVASRKTPVRISPRS